jgi:hypothetical protein
VVYSSCRVDLSCLALMLQMVLERPSQHMRAEDVDIGCMERIGHDMAHVSTLDR